MRQRAESAAREAFEAFGRERRAIVERDGETLALQLEVASIAAPTGDEGARAAWVSGRLREAGLDPRTDDAGNVIASCGTPESAPVAVFAHLDTVFSADTALHVRREGARFMAPGVSDNSRGLAAMLTVARAFARAGRHGGRPVDFVATTGEEGTGDLRGARHYLAHAPTRPAAVVVIDGAGDDRIVHVALGSRRFRIGYQGPGGHSWSAFGTPNPVHAAARAATFLADLRLPSRAKSTLSVNRIGGGLAINAIPETAWLEVDARSTDEPSLERIERDIREVAAAAATHENEQRSPGAPPISLVIERIGARAGGETPPDSILVEAALTATRLVGRDPQLATASTDANAAVALGIPAVAIGGGGRGGDTHTLREWYENHRGAVGVERALTLVATMARLAPA